MKGMWVAAALVLAACGDDSTGPDGRRVYEIQVAEETFRIALDDAELIAKAESMLATGSENNIHGTLVRGDGGFNEGYSWHLDPETITFPDLTMEICDGRPRSDVEGDLEYWMSTVKYYCPWGARVTRRI